MLNTTAAWRQVEKGSQVSASEGDLQVAALVAKAFGEVLREN